MSVLPSSKRIVVAHYYLEGREVDAERGLYPRSHLWGIPGLKGAGFEVDLLSRSPRARLWNRLTRLTRGALGDLEKSREILHKAQGAAAVYLVTGEFPLVERARAGGRLRCPVFSWSYNPPSKTPGSRSAKLGQVLVRQRRLDGYLCLNTFTEAFFRKSQPDRFSRYVPWGADTVMFQPSELEPAAHLLACGRSGRDFGTLIAAAPRFQMPLKLLAPRDVLGGAELPANVQFVGGPTDSGTDKGVPYADLVRLQQDAIGHLIVIKDDPHTAAGLTNLLEAMSVGRPVIMSRTGCLGIDIESIGCGLWAKAGDPSSLAVAVGKLLRMDASARGEMGRKGRAYVEQHHTIRHLDEGVARFFCDALGTKREG